MIPILYSAAETAFTSNGLGRLSDCIKCTVKEVINGIYELEMVYPVTGVHYSDIQEHNIISAYTDDTHTREPFEIYRISRPFNRRVTVNAWHLSYRLRTMVTMPFTATTVSSAITSLQNSIVGDNPFTFTTDKTTSASMAVVVPTVVRSLMGGIEGSFIDTYGGEWEYKGFTCALKNRRGNDTDVSIRYGKNLTDVKKVSDTSNMFSGIVPYWTGTDANDQEIQVVYNGVIYADDRSAFPYQKIIAADATENFDSPPTQSQLETWGESYIQSHAVTAVQQSIDVSFVELWQTEEYKNVAALQRLFIGDSVHVYYSALGVDNTARIVGYEYDVLGEMYNYMTLGSVKASLKSEVQADIDSAKASWGGNIDARLAALSAEIASTTVYLQGQIDAKVETWYQSSDPSTAWATASERANHIGDLWFYTGETTSTRTQNSTYRYNASGVWEECEVSEDVFDMIDGKSAIFYGAPSGTYAGVAEGDYLVDSSDGSTYRYHNNVWQKVTDYGAEISALETSLQSQIDSKIETWYQSSDPASSWATSDAKAQHVGDLWFYTGSTTSTRTQNATYRYSGSGSSYSWVECEVSQELFDEIDGKSTIYYGTPSGTYTGVENGDYLVDSTDGSTYRRNNNQWVKVTDYSTAVSNVETALQTQIDAKIETYFQSTDPASSWTTTALKSQHVGDLWFYTGSTTSTRTENATYRYTLSGSTYSWTECEVSTEVFDTIDGKATIFYGAPTGTYSGVSANDYLVDPSTSLTYRWSGSQWVKVTDWSSDISTAVTNATNLIKGGLGGYVVINTDANGKPQEILIMDKDSTATAVNVIRLNKNGIGFSRNGYNGTYTNAWTIDGNLVADFITTGTMSANRIKGGTLALGGLNNSDGVMLIYNSSGTEIGRWDNTGLTVGKGTIQGPTIKVGGASNTNGEIIVYNASGTEIGRWNNAGVTISRGSFTTTSNDGKTVTKVSAGVVDTQEVIYDALNPETIIATYRVLIDGGTITGQEKTGSSWVTKAKIDLINNTSQLPGALITTTQPAGDSSTKAATTAFVGTAISNIKMWKTVQKSVSVSVAANSNLNILANTDESDILAPAFDIGTQSGYSPVAAVKVTTGNNNVVVRSFNAEATGTTSMVMVRNVSNSSASATVTIEVLYLNNTYKAS